mmetsp:Transcript_14291/g.44703  ORF Transcript_14291/g.44703 Transcript_14291/m.44703 type:complete len:743 (+) Transcript_14291:1-2229(+)
MAAPGVQWPGGWCALVAPGASAAEGLELGTPAPCKAGDVAFWSLGGPGKARLRVLEDENGLLQLSEAFTVGVVFRAGAGGEPGHDSILLGHDNKHWLALEGGKRTLCVVDASTGKATPLDHVVSTDSWSVAFLQPRGSSTAVFVFDEDGLGEVGVVDLSVSGSRLRSMGWADNEVQVAQVVLWKHTLSWREMARSIQRESPPVLPDPDPLAKPERSFHGQVVDTSGQGLEKVMVSWSTGGCLTDEDGCFAASLSDAETDVPETASSSSHGSADSWLSFSFSREGFAPAAVPAQGVPGQQSSLQVTLRPLSASAAISLEKGGSVTDPASGSSVTVPPNGLVYPDGSPVTGEVTVSLSVIDATDPASLASMPGDFSAVAEDGSTVFLQSLGAAWIGATDEAGRQLEVSPDSPGVTLDLKSNASANSEKLGALPDMWSFDETSGKWELEPAAMKVDGQPVPNPSRPSEVPTPAKAPRSAAKRRGKKKKGSYVPEGIELQTGISAEQFRKMVARPGAKSLSANVMKMGYINCDIAYAHPSRAVMLTGRILGPGGQPLAHTQLWSVGKDYGGRCPDVTDAEGKFQALAAQFDSEVDVEVHVRHEVTNDAKLEIYFDKFPRHLNKDALAVLENVVGPHAREESPVNGQAAWAYRGSKVSWCPQRHQWQHALDGKLVFVRDEPDEPPAPPFGPSWRLASSFKSMLAPVLNIAPPNYQHASIVKRHSVGPFHTGSPGEFVDLGELAIKCT